MRDEVSVNTERLLWAVIVSKLQVPALWSQTSAIAYAPIRTIGLWDARKQDQNVQNVSITHQETGLKPLQGPDDRPKSVKDARISKGPSVTAYEVLKLASPRPGKKGRPVRIIASSRYLRLFHAR